MKLNEKLIELRKQKGLSQEELGYKINVSRQTISKWESEQTNPEVEKVKELSKLFGVSIEYLLNDEMENPKVINKNKKNKKLILTLLIGILSIYLTIVIYKFTILLICNIKANNIADYNNYTISTTTEVNDKLRNEYTCISNDETYNNGIQILTQYEDDKETVIQYINLKENKAYELVYDEEIGKYVYNNLLDYHYDEPIEEIYIPVTIKEFTKSSIPDNFKSILFTAINLKAKVSLGEGYFKIMHNFPDGGSYEVMVNSKTGIVESRVVITDRSILMESYSYVFDNNLIPGLSDEPDLENIDYIVEENMDVE